MVRALIYIIEVDLIQKDWRNSVSEQDGRNSGTSYIEQLILHAIRQELPEAAVKHRHKIDFGPKLKCEYDVVIRYKGKTTTIEYNENLWHKHRNERDKLKAELCEQAGIHNVVVWADHEYKEEPRILNGKAVILNSGQFRKGDTEIKKAIGGWYSKL